MDINAKNGKNLRQLITEASQQLSTYKHPNTTEAQKRIDEILRAADIGGIAHDSLDSIVIEDDEVIIETSWSSRGCLCSGRYNFPENILDAEQPLKTATIWGIQKKISENSERLIGAKQDVLRYENQQEELNNQLEALK